MNVKAQVIAEAHLAQSLYHTSKLQGITRDNLACMNLFVHIVENLFHPFDRRSVVIIYHIVNEIDMIFFLLEFR